MNNAFNSSSETLRLDRLLQVQEEGVVKTEADLENLYSFKADYEQAIATLQELEKSLTKPAYIPFGRKALIPGLLVHTNEILVHLGGSANLFAEVSTHQAVQLLQRRIQKLDDTISTLNKQKDLISERMQYTSEFLRAKPVGTDGPDSPSGEVEIREEYDSEAELTWKQKHVEARQRERLGLGNSSPPKLRSRRVRFKKIDNDKCSNAETSNSDACQLHNMIHFTHSESVPCAPRISITDWDSVTPAEAVNIQLKHGNITLSSPVQPFGDIIERTSAVPSDLPCDKPARTSRFRLDRSRKP